MNDDAANAGSDEPPGKPQTVRLSDPDEYDRARLASIYHKPVSSFLPFASDHKDTIDTNGSIVKTIQLVVFFTDFSSS